MSEQEQCNEVRQQLSAYVDGELDEPLRAQIERHLFECAGCQKELDELRRTIKAVKELPRVAAPPDFSGQIMSQLSGTTPPPEAAARPVRKLWTFKRLAAAAAIVLGVGILINIAMEPLGLTPSQIARDEAANGVMPACEEADYEAASENGSILGLSPADRGIEMPGAGDLLDSEGSTSGRRRLSEKEGLALDALPEATEKLEAMIAPLEMQFVAGDLAGATVFVEKLLAEADVSAALVGTQATVTLDFEIAPARARALLATLAEEPDLRYVPAIVTEDGKLKSGSDGRAGAVVLSDFDNYLAVLKAPRGEDDEAEVAPGDELDGDESFDKNTELSMDEADDTGRETTGKDVDSQRKTNGEPAPTPDVATESPNVDTKTTPRQSLGGLKDTLADKADASAPRRITMTITIRQEPSADASIENDGGPKPTNVNE